MAGFSLMNNRMTPTIYHHDQLTSVTDLSAHDGQEQQSLQYRAFGELGAVTGSTPNRLRYTGREQDPETNLYYYRARYYDPSIGRFISEDPIGFDSGDVNFYAYVGNNPINANDPSGKVTFTFGGEIHAPSWAVWVAQQMGIIDKGIDASGFQVGIAKSFPFFDGAEWDSGIYFGPQVAGIDIGTGMAAMTFGLQAGSVKNLVGNSDLTSFFTWAPITAGVVNDADTGVFVGAEVGVGAGYNIGQTIDITNVWSDNHGLLMPDRGASRQEGTCVVSK